MNCPLCGAKPIRTVRHCEHPLCPWLKFVCGNLHYPKFGTNKGCAK